MAAVTSMTLVTSHPDILLALRNLRGAVSFNDSFQIYDIGSLGRLEAPCAELSL